MRLPIGIQDFILLRESRMIYVDKTALLEPLLGAGRYFFARPRRFGKSLLISTIQAAFMGRKDVFSGLWLENNFDFKPRPVVRLDFSRLDFQARSLEAALLDSFQQSAKDYGLRLQAQTPKTAFEELIVELSKIQKVVVLIDEYDQAITDVLFEPEKRKAHTEILKSVFGVLKPLDAYLHLVWITGVSKMGKLSLFSSLNNIQDISLNPKYALLCGYTHSEIENCFPEYLKAAAESFNLPLPELWAGLERWFNGYSWDGLNKVYCPFSFLLFLEHPVFKSYWYETGTPTWLIELIKNRQVNPLELEQLSTDSMTLAVTDVENLEPIGLMFQTGYLTIRQIQKSAVGTRYLLSYPNQEVRVAFSRGLLGEYSRLLPSAISGFAFEFYDALHNLDWETLFTRANQVFASIPYEIFPRAETYINSLWHLMLVSTGLRVQSQVQTSLGRMDTLLETSTHHIIFELKIGGSVNAATKQITENVYAKGLRGLPILGVGVVFDLKSKSFTEWQILEF